MTRKAGLGEVATAGPGAGFLPPAGAARPHYGWKGDDREGVRVQLAKVQGATKDGLLEVPFRFQVPPLESIQRVAAFGYTDFDTLRSGQHSRPLGRQLRTIAFQTLVVDWDATFAIYPNPAPTVSSDDVWDVIKVVGALEKIAFAGTPIQLSYGQPSLWGTWDFDEHVTLRNVTSEEKAGEVDARYISLEFTEYRSLKLSTQSYGSGAKNSGPKANESKTPTTIQVTSKGSTLDTGDQNHKFGDDDMTLSKVSKHFYGTTHDWDLIAKANKSLKDNNWTPSRPLVELLKHVKAPVKIKVPRKP